MAEELRSPGEWLGIVLGAGAGGLLLLALCALLLSVPVTAALSLRVALRREWLPVMYNLRSLSKRRTSTLATLLGLTLVVFGLTAILMLATGIRHTLASSGGESNVKVMRKMAVAEGMSYLLPDEINRIKAAPEIAQSSAGLPLFSPEMMVLIWLPRAGAADPDDGTNVNVRGVEPIALELRPQARISGRLFEPGKNEVVIGRSLVGRYAGATLGGRISFAGHEWSVVGVADHGGTAHDSEIWGDYGELNAVFRRIHAAVTLVLRDEADFAALAARLSADKQLAELKVARERDYWDSVSKNAVTFVTIIGVAVGLIFAFGAVLGAMNTMYGQVAARTRELGTLRALGFKPRSIVTSLVLESVLLALGAGVLGVLGASLLEPLEFQLTTVQTLSELTYGFHLDAQTAGLSLLFAALMGYAGGLPPALKAARMPVVDAVRAD